MHARQTMARSKTAKISASDHCRHAASSRQTEATIDKTGEAPAIGLPGLPSPSGSWNRHPTADTRAHKREKRAGGEVHRRAAALTGTQWSFATLRPGRAWQSAHCARWVSDLHLHTRAIVSRHNSASPSTNSQHLPPPTPIQEAIWHPSTPNKVNSSLPISSPKAALFHGLSDPPSLPCRHTLPVSYHKLVSIIAIPGANIVYSFLSLKSILKTAAMNQSSSSPTAACLSETPPSSFYSQNLSQAHIPRLWEIRNPCLLFLALHYSINAVGSQQQEQHPNY
ncbi:hypothetical protein TgHK011_003716 [Trichoderma gracile]|nr:hypothetical protein TgHK011_003716 [Trichoderma gracile]